MRKAFFASCREDLNFVTFVLFVVINFLTTKDTKHAKEEVQRKKAYPA